jgi:DNA-binding GntR family transcriptional regulator
MHARLERHAAAGDVGRYYEENRTFHQAVQELAANPWLSRAASDLRRQLRLLRGRQLRLPGRLEASLAEHRRFMRALRRRDPEEAERAMRAHLLAQRAALAAAPPGPLPPAPRGAGTRAGSRRTPGSRGQARGRSA